MAKKSPLLEANATSPLILLAGGDYWFNGFHGLDRQDRGRDNAPAINDYFDKHQSDNAIINHGLLIEGLAPLYHQALQLLIAPDNILKPEKFLNGLLAKISAPRPIATIKQNIYYQSSRAIKKSRILTMRLHHNTAMVYMEKYKPQQKKSPSPFITPAGAGWQLIRVRGKKRLNDFLSAFIAHTTESDNFYHFRILTKPIYLFYQGDEALFFLPRSSAVSLLCHLAMVAASKSDNITRIRIYYES
ncbi:MAG: hypothetical protein ACR2NY_04700 [Alphaproteobacteria bacterium]